MAAGKTTRARSVGTKLNEEEYARLEAQAARRGLTVGEWVREIVLKASEPQPGIAAEQMLLSEVLPGEQVAYTYDSLNRLATAQTQQSGGTQWGQSCFA